MGSHSFPDDQNHESEHSAPPDQHEVPDSNALAERIMQTYAALNGIDTSANVGVAQDHGKTFIRDFVDRLQPAADEAALAGESNALVIQYSELLLGAETADREEPAFNAFMRGMGAHVTGDDGSRYDIFSDNIGSLMQPQSSSHFPLRTITESGAMASPDGSFVIAETSKGTGNLETQGLLLESNIPGVRIWLDGRAITRFPESRGKGAVRPMLLVSTSTKAGSITPEADHNSPA